MGMEKIGVYNYVAEPFHCDFTHRLFMSQLGNHLLNASDFHSAERGFGMPTIGPQGRTWVLSRLAVEMEEMPRQYSEFRVETWLEGAMKYFTNRNYRITAGDGRVLGHGRSVWAMIDTADRQPQDVLSVAGGKIADWVVEGEECPIAKVSRVKMGAGAKLVRTIDTYYNDVDVNGHVNSVKYIEHVLDLFGMEWHRTHRLARFEIAYVAESHGGDRLAFYREQTGDGEYCVRIAILPENGEKEVETCRSKVKFVNI